jgi:hypothetical protein
MLNAMKLPYYLSSGTLIGEWRCNDVLPWSEDADIHIPAAAVAEFFKKVFGQDRKHVKPDVMVTHEDNALVPPELVVFSWGWESSYHKEQPMGIGDRRTGFYMDVWTEEEGPTVNGSEWVYRYWKYAPHKCPTMKGYTSNRCFQYPKELIYPLRSCTVAGVVHKCPHDTTNFLNVEYGPGFSVTPNQYQNVLTQITNAEQRRGAK